MEKSSSDAHLCEKTVHKRELFQFSNGVTGEQVGFLPNCPDWSDYAKICIVPRRAGKPERREAALPVSKESSAGITLP
ncbi:hypothetical protein ABE504_17790 [Paenibacillus oryzisoli]|uniref:hypothetical protein n=1 Tax=Paenibacillus oryzisoli TaxID=1850517 RepID=UPI003D2AB652